MSFFLTVIAVLMAGGSASSGADDYLHKGNDPPLPGQMVSMTRTEVVFKGRSNQREYRVPANEIDRIRWADEKPQLGQIRIEERNERFDKAITDYENLLKDANSENLRAEIEFLIARTMASKALKEEQKYDAPISRLEKFRSAHSNNYHYFESLRLLARLYLAKRDLEKTQTTLQLMSQAPWNDYKMEAEGLKARAALARDDVDGALRALDGVLAIKPNTPVELSRHYEALLTKASCLQKRNKFQDATNILMGIIDEASDQDKKTLAETCVRLGDCQQAAGHTKEAILAYLRVDILFPDEKSQHAESLYYLSRLFVQDEQPDKAADAVSRLQRDYPRSTWTAKLTVTPK